MLEKVHELLIFKNSEGIKQCHSGHFVANFQFTSPIRNKCISVTKESKLSLLQVPLQPQQNTSKINKHAGHRSTNKQRKSGGFAIQEVERANSDAYKTAPQDSAKLRRNVKVNSGKNDNNVNNSPTIRVQEQSRFCFDSQKHRNTRLHIFFNCQSYGYPKTKMNSQNILCTVFLYSLCTKIPWIVDRNLLN